MMATTLRQLSETIADALRNVGGCGLDVTPYPTQGATPPYADLALVSWDVQSFGSSGESVTKMYEFVLRVFTAGRARPQDGYGELLDLMDSATNQSIDVAVWDLNLGQSISIHVSSARMLGVEAVDGVGHYGAEFTIEVVKKGSD